MLRIWFTRDDLLRTRVDRADPLWETALSMHTLQRKPADPVFTDWREAARRKISRLDPMLATLCPPRGRFADSLTPPGAGAGIAQGLEVVRSTPKSRLRADVAVLAAERRLPAWTARLADGDRELVDLIGDRLAAYHRAVIAPWWPRIQAQVDAERAALARQFIGGGTEQLLAGLGPWARWRDPVLEVDYPNEHTLHLEGRGLRLVPSYFCTELPVTLIDASLEPVLVFPAFHGPAILGEPGQRYLDELLGETRARVLAALENGCNTSELARRAEISQSSASRHAAILRDAGFVVSRRYGGSVVHVLTQLGVSVLTGGNVRPN